jgi:hypothetical protein
VDPSRLGAADAVAGAGADQLALEFCDAADDRDHQLADRCCCVRPCLAQRFELRAGLTDLVENVEQIAR